MQVIPTSDRQRLNAITCILFLTHSAFCFSEAGESPMLETVVVTSQHWPENTQDIAVTSSVLNSETIEQLDIHNANRIAENIPGVSFAPFAPGQSLIAIRGIISADDGAGMDNSIAIFVDDIYVGRHAMVDFDLFDIQHIEILKGPQGTLSGRNAIGGSINIETKAPSDTQDSRISLTKGTYNAQKLRAFHARPLSDNLSANISMNVRQRDGFTRNVLIQEDNQDEDTHSVRTRWRYSTDDTDWLITADYTSDQQSDMGRTPIFNNGAFDYVALWETLGGEPHAATSPISGFSKRSSQGVSIKSQSQFESGTLTTIAGWRSAKSDWEMASVGAPLGGNYDLDAGIFGVDVNDDILESITQTSLELRWTSKQNNAFDYSAGAFALKENTERIEQYKLDRNTVSTGQVTVGNEVSDQSNTTQTFALYGHTHWELDPKWALILGARISFDKKDTETLSLNCGQQANTLVSEYAACDVGAGSLAILQDTFSVNVDHDWLDISPKIAIEFHPAKNTMLYGSISKGYKSGGFSGSPGVEEFATTPIKPEKVWNYELGIKHDWLNHHLRTNASVFYMDYTNLQSVHFGPSQLNPGFGSFITTNIDKTDISGFEFDGAWIINQYWRIDAAYAYLESEVKDFQLNTLGGDIDLSGTPLRQAPQNSSAITHRFYLPLTNNRGTLSARLQYQYKGGQISDYINQATRIDAIELFNTGIQWISQNDTWEVDISVNNLKDRRYIAHAYSVGPGVIGVWGQPRTSQMTITWRQ